MKTAKRKKLERAGWAVGSAEEFLELSEDEQAMVEIKLALADAVRVQREKHKLSQVALAARMKSSQSRIAKIEAGDPTVSLDLLVRAALAAGATRKDLGKAFTAR